MKKLVATVRETIEKYQLIQPQELVIASVSGGPDSLTMLHVLKKLSPQFAFSLHVVHFDHTLRGREGALEAAWVKDIAAEWGLPCTLIKMPVAAFAEKRGLSIQEAGHLLRREHLKTLLKEIGAHKVALGHQADDQAETVLMHFLVGAGLEGLQGLTPRNGPLIRPLLFVYREAIETYCQQNKLEPRRDPSNLENVYLRNRIRNQIIPWLENELNPNLVATLNRTAVILQAEAHYLRREALQLASQLISSTEKGISLSLKDWSKLHLSMQRRLILLAYQQLTKRQGVAFFHVERIVNFVYAGEVGKVLQLPGKINVEKSYETLVFYRQTAVRSPHITCRALEIPGETFFPEIGQKIVAEIVKGLPGKSEKNKVYLPWEKVRQGLYGRSRKAGDRFSFPGLVGRKRVKDFLREQKIPHNRRDLVLLITTTDQIVWLPGLAITQSCLEKSDSGKYLCLKINQRNP